MTSKLARAAVILAWLGIPGGASLGQQSALQAVPKAPPVLLDIQVEPPAESHPDDDSQQGKPVMTHVLPAAPENPTKPAQPQASEPSADDGGQQTAPQDTGRAEPDRSMESDRTSSEATDSTPGGAPVFGGETPRQRAAPTARDFARYDRGSLLDRASPGFAPLPARDRPVASAEYDPETGYDPCELLVSSETMDEARSIQGELSSLSIDIRRRFALPNLGIVVSVFCVPDPGETEQAMATLRRQYPTLAVTLNHRYRPAAERRYYAAAIGWRNDLYACGSNRRIGLVDTGIDLQHPAFADARVTTKNLLSPGSPAADLEHGTATASVLAGASGEAPGLLNTADLVAANVFRQSSDSIVDTNAELLVRAVDWLLGEGVELINMSLAGPANDLLEFAVEAASASGVLIVAAAGNGDRNPAYPAAYPAVTAVTAVDSRTRVYARANRGDYIDFAAPGVDLYLAAPGNRSKYYTGTSFAAPFVTAALAVLKTLHPDSDPAVLLEQLASGAVDLGDAGRDPTFGWGLVQAPADCQSLAARE